jgi:hypothetical protein
MGAERRCNQQKFETHPRVKTEASAIVVASDGSLYVADAAGHTLGRRLVRQGLLHRLGQLLRRITLGGLLRRRVDPLHHRILQAPKRLSSRLLAEGSCARCLVGAFNPRTRP